MHIICCIGGLDVDIDVDEHTTLASFRQQVCAAADLASGPDVFVLHGLDTDADLTALSAGDVINASPHPRVLARQRLVAAGFAATDEAFHEACGGGGDDDDRRTLSARVVADYLEAGFDPRGEGGRASLPLPHVVAAVMNGDAAVVETLLKAGASPCARLRGVLGCLSLAVSRGFRDVAEVLIRHGASAKATSLMFTACSHGFEEVVDLLLRSGAGATDKNALRASIERGHTGIVRRLLEAGANGSNWAGTCLAGTPLSLAVRNKRVGCVRELLEHGVPVTEEEVKEWVAKINGMSGDAVELRRLLWKHMEPTTKKRRRKR